MHKVKIAPKRTAPAKAKPAGKPAKQQARKQQSRQQPRKAPSKQKRDLKKLLVLAADATVDGGALYGFEPGVRRDLLLKLYKDDFLKPGGTNKAGWIATNKALDALGY